MPVLEIKKYPDKILRKNAIPVKTTKDEGLQQLIDDMIATMYDAPGMGLAAPQVGVSLRLCVIDTTAGKEPEGLYVLINPEIVETSGGEEIIEEGCLSIPGYHYDVKRATHVVVCYTDRDGKQMRLEADNLLSRALQHEIDHLNGMLFIDRIGTVRKDQFKRKYKKGLAGA